MPRNIGLLKLSECAKLLRVSWDCLDKILRSGDLPHVRVGKRRRVRLRDLEWYITPPSLRVA